MSRQDDSKPDRDGERVYFTPSNFDPEIRTLHSQMYERMRKYVVENEVLPLDYLYTEIWSLAETQRYVHMMENSPVARQSVRACFQLALRSYIDRKGFEESRASTQQEKK